MSQLASSQLRGVTLVSDKCRDAFLQCLREKRTVTFARTGDVDVNSLPDPGGLPPRLASPAEVLHGRYHMTRKFANGAPSNPDEPAVFTDCLRTGDRCMSYFHSGSFDTPMVFGGGNWNVHVEHDEDAPNWGGQLGVKITAQTRCLNRRKIPLRCSPGTVISTRTGPRRAKQTLISTKHTRASATNPARGLSAADLDGFDH
ncbi:MAG: hypothetical protein ACLP3C_33640 [Mycobacterium sp.]|uniref:hypothetical protein n=1 Tax=Mycobacterium sp. TaxID=1785 RepID=UPI003F965FB1